MSTTKESVLSVKGMSCRSCVRHVEAALRDITGVAKVEASVEQGEVRVAHDGRAGINQMIEALVVAGYESRAAGG